MKTVLQMPDFLESVSNTTNISYEDVELYLDVFVKYYDTTSQITCQKLLDLNTLELEDMAIKFNLDFKVLRNNITKISNHITKCIDFLFDMVVGLPLEIEISDGLDISEPFQGLSSLGELLNLFSKGVLKNYSYKGIVNMPSVSTYVYYFMIIADNPENMSRDLGTYANTLYNKQPN